MVERGHHEIPSRSPSKDRATDPPRASARSGFPGPRVFLVRHANAEEGPKDPDRGRHLTALGRQQAQALARRLANWQLDAILCSDMHRACDTATEVHSFHAELPLIVDPVFREVSAGTLVAFDRGDPAVSGLDERLEAAWEKIVTLPYEVAVIVTHNGMIKYLLGRTIQHSGALKPRFHSAQTGITAIQVRAGRRAFLQFFNDTHHLTPDIATEELASDKAPWIEDATTGRWHFGAPAAVDPG